MSKLSKAWAIGVCFSAMATVVIADDVEDAVKEGMTAYRGGDFSTAASQLDYAATLIRQQKAGKVTAVFPAPLPGWTADDAESNSAGGMMMGGGIAANRSYHKGNTNVDIQLVMDSPMMQSVMMMFNNPSMIAMSGGKLIKVQGHKAMLKKDGDSVSVTLVVNGNAMFTLEGYGASASDLKAYASKLNLSALQ